MNKHPAEPPYKQGDWITTAYAHSLCYAPEGQRVWQATATPVRKEWGWATDDKSGVSAAHFRLATREDVASEIEHVVVEMETLGERRDALENWYLKTAKETA